MASFFVIRPTITGRRNNGIVITVEQFKTSLESIDMPRLCTIRQKQKLSLIEILFPSSKPDRLILWRSILICTMRQPRVLIIGP